MQQQRSGFTRVELVSLIVFVLLMVGLLIPWIFQKRGVSQRNFCESRQIILAKGLFLHATEAPCYPGFREVQAVIDQITASEDADKSKAETMVATSWVFPILPYIHPAGSKIADQVIRMEAAELVDWEDADTLREGPYARLFVDFGETGNRAGKKVPDYITELVCPESERSPTAAIPQPLSFVANCGMPDRKSDKGPLDHLANGVFFDRVTGSQMQTMDYIMKNDGLQTTLLLSENLNAGQAFDGKEYETGFVWVDSMVDGIADRDPQLLFGINQGLTEPSSFRTARPSSYHAGGVNVAFADGSTMFLNAEIDYLAFVQYMTTNGFETRVAGTQNNAQPPYRLTR